MKEVIFLMGLVFVVIGCKKIKEQKYTGVYEGIGTYRIKYDYMELPDYDTSYSASVKVYREEDQLIFSSAFPGVNIKDVVEDQEMIIYAGNSSIPSTVLLTGDSLYTKRGKSDTYGTRLWYFKGIKIE